MAPNKTIILSTIVLGCILSFNQNLYAQKYKEITTREIFLTNNDSIFKFYVLLKPSSKKANINLNYYWYGSEMVHTNRGGYAGNLLDGKYLVLDKKMRLRVEGFFKEGLKTGTWKSWRETGELSSIIKYKKGLKKGKSSFYDNAGNLQKTVTYKNDLMNGPTFIYRGNLKEKIKYKKGIEIKKENQKPEKTVKPSEKKPSTGDSNTTKKDNFFKKVYKKVTKPLKKSNSDKTKDVNTSETKKKETNTNSK